MLIIDSPKKTVVVRKTVPDDYRSHALVLRHNATGEVFVMDAPKMCSGQGYYRMTVDMAGKPYGEYTYYITGNDPRWTITADPVDIHGSYYIVNDVYLGAVTSDIYISAGSLLAISEGSDERFPLDVLQCGLLQYFSFQQHTNQQTEA